MSGINLAPGETGIARIVAAIRQIMQGRSNAVGQVTLTANAATTAVTAPNCGPGSEVFLFQKTPNAAAEIGNGTIYILAADVVAGTFTITHANSAQTDRTFSYVALG